MSGETDCLSFNEYDIIIWTQGSMFVFVHRKKRKAGRWQSQALFLLSTKEQININLCG